MAFWGFNRFRAGRPKRRPSLRARNRIAGGLHYVGLEPLEMRNLLTVTLNPIVGTDTNSTFAVPAGKDLYVPLTSTDPGQTVTYTATSSNSNIAVSVLTGNPTLQLTVQGVDSEGNNFSGTMTVQLFENLAPDTVSVIENLVNTGFYDGLSFYRIVPAFVIQGGANGTKTAPDFADEFNVDATFNSPGLLAMANPGTADSNTSEIFITDISQPTSSMPQYLNFRHTIFGQLTSGFDIYNSIMKAEGISSSNSTPTTPVTITSATIITDTQNGVLQVSEPAGYSGNSTITVTAHSTDGSTSTQTFVVSAAPLTSTSSTQPLYLDPIGDKVTQANTPISFNITANQYFSSKLTFSVSGADGFTSTPSNVTVQVTQNSNNTATVTLTPAASFTGTVNLVVHASDTSNAIYDAQQFSLTVQSSLAVSDVTSPINSANEANTSISGTGTAGDSISVTATDGTNTTSAYSATVDSNGQWTISGIDVSSLADGTITYNVSATNNSGTTTASQTSSKDTQPPANMISTATSPVNQSNVSSASVSGTSEAGAAISLTVTHGTNTTSAYTATAAGDGTWSISGINLSSLTDGTITYTATATDGAGNSTQTTKTGQKDTAAPTLNVETVTNPVDLSTSNDATVSGTSEAGATISVTVTDGTHTTSAHTATVAGDGTWTVSGIDVSSLNDGSIVFVVTATDTAGNAAEQSLNSTKSSVVISVATNPVNAANASSASASGTGQAGATVSLVVSDGTHSTSAYTTTIAENGTWSISGIDLSSLDDGTITYTATATDGQEHSAQSTKTASKDTVAPAVTADQVTSPINASNASSTAISGTGEAGATISVVASDGTNSTTAMTATVDSSGNWSISGLSVSALVDGTITYTVTATDGAGNATTITKTATKDTVAPTVSLDQATNPINIANSGSVTASGTGEAGATISVVATDGTNTTVAVTTTVLGDGAWSVSGIDVSGLADGAITYKVTASDGAGNTAEDTLSATKATVNVTVVTSPVNNSNASSASASGTGQVGATVSLVVTDGTSTTTAYTATIGSDGTWSITGIDVSALADGTITFKATATDGPNSALSSKTTAKDTVAPAVAVTSVTNPIDNTTASSTTASGTGEAGATISLVVSDGTNSTAAKTATVASDGTWSISGIDVSALADGTLTYKVTATDTAGNTAQTSSTTTKSAAATASLSGFVYVDANKNGTLDAAEHGLAGVILTLRGNDSQGKAIESRTTVTGSDGSYTFSNLPVGTYSITESQPTKIADGSPAAGSLGGTGAGNTIGGIQVASGASGTNYNFSESGFESSMISMRLFLASSPPLGEAYNSAIADYGINAPVVTSIVKADADPASGSTVRFTVTFNQSVTGVDATDFAVTGTSGGSIASVTGSGTTYTVTVNVGSAGTLGLSLNDDDSIVSSSSKPLGGSGAGNDDFDGPSYTISAASVTVAISTVTSPINAANQSSVSASGTGTSGDSISLVASDGTHSTSAYTATVGSDGNWSISGINTSSLSDGTVTFTVTATRADNSTGQATKTATKDAVAPAVALSTVTSPINATNASQVSASGTGEVGATISLVASDGTSSSTTYSATVASDGTWSISGIDTSSLADGTITFTVTAADAAGNTAQSTKTSTKDTVAPTVNVTQATDPLTIANHKSASASGTGEAGASISLVVTDGTHTTQAYTTTLASDGAWSISGIDTSSLNDGTVTYNATATDGAGNTAQSSHSATKTTVAVTSVTDPINAAHAANVSVAGTGEAGATITLVVTDGTHNTQSYTTTISNAGAWSISEIDTTGLDDGTLTFQVTAADGSNNQATTSRTASKDTVAPTGAITTVPANIGSAAASTVAVSGTGEAGATVSLVVGDGTNQTSAYTATVGSDGTWSIANADVSSLADGTLTFTATFADAAGNTSTATATANKDTVAPAVSITSIADPITIANHKSLQLGGTGEAGSIIHVVVTDGVHRSADYTATVGENGNWSVSGIDVSGLADGSITFQVTATDGSSNSQTVDHSATKDTLAPTLTINLLTSSITLGNQASTQVSGTGEAGDSISLVASDGTNTTDAYTTTVDQDGNWSINGVDVSALVDSTITYTATAADGAGNTAQDSATGTKRTVAITSVTEPITSSNLDAVTASGTGQVGATISLIVTDGTNSTTAHTTTVGEDGNWSITNIDVSSLAETTLTFKATADDGSGHTAQSVRTAHKDTVAPAVEITAVPLTINSAGSSSVTVSGTGEAGASLLLMATDGANSTTLYNSAVGEDGTWTITGVDVSGLADGTITFTVVATDEAGNSNQSELTSTKDATAPTVTVGSVTDPIDPSNVAAAAASGTGEAGATISLVVTDGTATIAAYTTTVGSDGNWSIAKINVSTLADGAVTFQVTATDAAGNTAQASLTATKSAEASSASVVDQVLADEEDWL